jgi:hypothetical protein
VAATDRDDRLRAALESLEGARAEDRFLAGRYLAVHVRPGDGRLLLTGVENGGPETRLRLVDALGGEDRHILVAGELIDAAVEPRTALGTEIMAELILRWNPDYAKPATSRARLLATLGQHRTHNLLVAVSSSLEATVNALAHSGMLGAPLVLDPGLADGVRRGGREQTASVFRGTWDLVLDQIVLGRGATWEAFGFSPAGSPDPPDDPGIDAPETGNRAFFRICLQGSEGSATALEHLLRWCTQFVGQGELPLRTAAARALAASGWPAALVWMESRAEADEAARSGLLLAASHGRLSPWFLNSARVGGLLASVDRALSQNDAGASRRAEELAAALAHLPVHGHAAGGGSLMGPLLEGWDDLRARSLWVRLVALEGVQPRAPGLRARVRALAADAGNPAGLRTQALRTLAALPDPPQDRFPIGSLDPLLERARARDGEEELASLLVSAGGLWVPQEGDMTSPASRAFLLSWALDSGDRAAALGILAADLAAGLHSVGSDGLPPSWDLFLDVLERRSIALDRVAVRSLLSEAFGEAERERWPGVFGRCALRAGCSRKEDDLRLLDGGLPPAELGRMVCGPAHRDARKEILDALGKVTGAQLEVWLEGAEAGIRGLWARMQDSAAEQFREEVRGALGKTGSALETLIRDGVWPLRPPSGAVRVDLMTRGLW